MATRHRATRVGLCNRTQNCPVRVVSLAATWWETARTSEDWSCVEGVVSDVEMSVRVVEDEVSVEEEAKEEGRSNSRICAYQASTATEAYWRLVMVLQRLRGGRERSLVMDEWAWARQDQAAVAAEAALYSVVLLLVIVHLRASACRQAL